MAFILMDVIPGLNIRIGFLLSWDQPKLTFKGTERKRILWDSPYKSVVLPREEIVPASSLFLGERAFGRGR